MVTKPKGPYRESKDRLHPEEWGIIKASNVRKLTLKYGRDKDLAWVAALKAI